jgi:hypothetical protein
MLLITGAAAIALSTLGRPIYLEIASANIRAQAGSAYVFDLAGLAPYPLAFLSDTEAAPSVSDLILTENGNPVGSPHSNHVSIKDEGGGRYSVWQGVLIFSTSDNTDPRYNGRRYAAETTAKLSLPWLIGGIVAILVALSFEFKILGRIRARIRSFPPVVWSVQNIFPPLFGTLVVFVAVAAVGELYWRNTAPFISKTWPNVWDYQSGFRFAPNVEVRHTNHVDFWTAERTNSVGFLDREPSPISKSKSCRVAFIGDSFIEAAQVKIVDKVQVRLEKLAVDSHPEWNLRASAFGYSGTGQLNQLPFYDQFVRSQTPQLVVLVAVSNDFANNSVLLESVRNGWHPDHSPRQFAARGKSGEMSLLPIAADWELYRRPPRPSPETVAGRANSWLMNHSYFYAWLNTTLRSLAQWAFAVDDGNRQWLIEHVPQAAMPLSDWDGKIQMDRMFFEQELPPVFKDAIAYTGFALDEFKSRTQRDGSFLVVLAASEMRLREKPDDPKYAHRFFDRLEALTSARSIPLLDQYAWVVAQGRNPKSLGFRLDAHWNEDGHDVAARMILNYLERHPEICSGSH